MKATTSLLGLRTIYAAVLTPSEDMSCAVANAETCAPIADRIINEDLPAGDQGELVQRLLNASRQAVSELPEDAEQETRDREIALHAFWIGIATCWRLMAAVNGTRAER
jgi:hypothetical protein